MNLSHENNDDTTFAFDANISALPGNTIVNMENFVPFIANAQCGSSQIKLTFTSQQAVQMANSNWPSNFTLMTSGAASCGSGSSGRTFYK